MERKPRSSSACEELCGFCGRNSRTSMASNHFIDMNTGERQWKCEISSIDTSLLLCGVLTARQHFADAEIQDLATKIYERVDWPWMLNGRSEEHTSELQSLRHLVCRLLLEKK